MDLRAEPHPPSRSWRSAHLSQHATIFTGFTFFVFHKVVGHVVAVSDKRALGPWFQVQNRGVQNPSDTSDSHHELCLTCQEICKGSRQG